MKKKIFSILFALVMVLSSSLVTAVPVGAVKPPDKGFDEYGYNYQARIFVGTGENWYRSSVDEPPWQEGDSYLWEYSLYSPDHLVMKWSKAWDDARFHGGDWTPKAWCTNEWNGMFPGGSQEVWHSTFIWVGPELEESPYWREGGQPIWGQFEIIMSHGVIDGEHIWEFPVVAPCGRGAS